MNFLTTSHRIFGISMVYISLSHGNAKEITKCNYYFLFVSRHKCDQCDKDFPNLYRLRDHKLSHTAGRKVHSLEHFSAVQN